MERAHRPLPEARVDRLVVQELMDEVVVYDPERHRSHCLNPAAATIWRHCDGKTSVAEMARQLQQESGVPIDEEAVWLGLHRLSKAHLLKEKVNHPASGDRASRRALLRHLAAVGGLALVSSILAPEAYAQTTIPIQCIQNCCWCFCPTVTCNCENNNACKCCFLPGGSTICSNDCGVTCQQQGGTCFQLSNNVCPPKPPGC